MDVANMMLYNVFSPCYISNCNCKFVFPFVSTYQCVRERVRSAQYYNFLVLSFSVIIGIRYYTLAGVK